MATRPPAVTTDTLLAVVISGQVRSFTDDITRRSIRRNAVDALCPPGTCVAELFFCAELGHCYSVATQPPATMDEYVAARADFAGGLQRILTPEPSMACDESEARLDCSGATRQWCVGPKSRTKCPADFPLRSARYAFRNAPAHLHRTFLSRTRERRLLLASVPAPSNVSRTYQACMVNQSGIQTCWRQPARALAPSGALGLLRLRGCYQHVIERERTRMPPRRYDWVTFLRFDMGFYKPLPSLAEFARIGAALFTPRSVNVGISDHWALVTRDHSDAYANAASQYCCLDCWLRDAILSPANRTPVIKAEQVLGRQLLIHAVPTYTGAIPRVLVRKVSTHNATALTTNGTSNVYLADCFRRLCDSTCEASAASPRVGCWPPCAGGGRIIDGVGEMDQCQSAFPSQSGVFEGRTNRTEDARNADATDSGPIRINRLVQMSIASNGGRKPGTGAEPSEALDLVHKGWDAKLVRASKSTRHETTLALSSQPAASTPSCIVFHEQHKSAGSTIIHVLRAHGSVALASHQVGTKQHAALSDIRRGIALTRCDTATWSLNAATCSFAKRFAYMRSDGGRILMGGYAMALAAHESFHRPRCKWMTIFREPISRLVSSYLYCRRLTKDRKLRPDPLCANGVLNASSASIEEWAEHWGNFLLRELLLHPKLRPRRLENSLERALQIDPVRANGSVAGDGGKLTAVWMLHKLVLKGADDPRTRAGEDALRSAAALLNSSSMFDGFGVVERWKESMQRFDHLMPLGGPGTWLNESTAHRNDHKSGLSKDQEAQILRAAKVSSVVREALRGDLYLYHNVVLPLFDRIQ